jgi:histidine triad (HIT) family protein
MGDTCPFCEIVADRSGEEVVYEDGLVIAFLCEPPATWGHLLVVPREHREDIWSIDVSEATAVMSAALRLAAVLRDELGAEGVNLRQNSGSLAGQDVFHFHLHLVPRYEGDTVQPGCVWGVPGWEPPLGGEAERRRVAAAIRRGVSAL